MSAPLNRLRHVAVAALGEKFEHTAKARFEVLLERAPDPHELRQALEGTGAMAAGGAR